MPRRVLPLVVAVWLAVHVPGAAHATAPPLRGPAPPELTQALAEGMLTLPPRPERLGTSAAPAVWYIPIILVSFSDSALTYGAPHFEHALFDSTGGTPTGSVYEYYDWVSGSRLTVVGRVVATVSLPHDRYYYAYLAKGLNRISTPNNAAGMVRHAIAAADDSVDWNEFDLDRDGFVDMLWVVHAGIPGEASNDPNDMWSITSVLSSYWNNAGAYVSDDLFLGSITLKVKLDRFSVLPELSAFHPGRPSEIGVYCHEFGHALGLPDLYDTVDGGRIDAGPGNWSLMSTGGYGGDGISPESPSHLGAWPMLLLGWSERVRTAADTTFVLGPIADGAPVVDITWQGEEQPEHYLIEVRRRTGFDRRLPGEGLVVYHLDEATIGRGLQANAVNAGPTPGLVVVEADGRHDLTSGVNRGEPFDVFPGPLQRFALPEGPSQPDTRTFAGAFTGLALSNITEVGPAVRFGAHVRAAGWQPAQLLAADGEESPRLTGTPHGIVRLEDGRIVHVRSEQRQGRAQLVLRERGSELWEPAAMVLETPGDAVDPALAALPGGDLALVWRDLRDGSSRLYYRARFRGAWTEERLLTPGSVEVQFPVIATDPEGAVMVAWLDVSASPRVRFQRFPWLSPWGTPVTLTAPDEAPEAPMLAAGPDGGAWVMWRDVTSAPPRLWFRRFHPDSAFLPRLSLAASAGGNQDWVTATVDHEGALHAAWVADGTTWREIHYQRRPRVGPPAPRDTVVEQRLGPIRRMQLATDLEGGVHLAYEHEADLPAHVRYLRRHPRRGWDAYSTEVTLPGDGVALQPELVADAPAQVTVVYLAERDGALRPAARRRLGDLTPALDVAGGPPPGPVPAWALVPNPLRAGRGLLVRSAAAAPPGTLELYDLAGRRVAAADFAGSPGAWQARLSGAATAGFAPGVYFARAGRAGAARRLVVIR